MNLNDGYNYNNENKIHNMVAMMRMMIIPLPHTHITHILTYTHAHILTHTYIQTDGQTDRTTDGQMDRQTCGAPWRHLAPRWRQRLAQAPGTGVWRMRLVIVFSQFRYKIKNTILESA